MSVPQRTRVPKRAIRPIARAVGVLAGVLACTALAGCGGSSSPKPQSPRAAAPADTLVEYTVRGRVQQLPGDAEHPAREFMVRHEAIPEFRASMAPGDDRMGMRSMAMAFPLDEGVSLDGIDAGTPIEMMFEATYDGQTGRLKGYVVRRLTPLDPGTALEIVESGAVAP